MVMRPIVGPDGKPLHRTARELIRPGLSHALGAWQRNVEESILEEHGPFGQHERMRFPKAALWIKSLRRTGSIQPGSVIGPSPAVHGENCEFRFNGQVGTLWEGEIDFYEGMPGEFAVLNSHWWEGGGVGPEREWEISGNILLVRLSAFVGFGVVIY